jgi:hypothetical protein
MLSQCSNRRRQGRALKSRRSPTHKRRLRAYHVCWSAQGGCFNHPSLQEIAMPQFAMISDDVTYTPGDGAPILIPPGRVEVALAFDSATLSWDAGDGVAGVTAIPLSQFDDYVQDGKISWIPE